MKEKNKGDGSVFKKTEPSPCFFDVIVVGAGHAGIEASIACARMGCQTLIITLSAKDIGLMSCNPAIGGVGKGQLVKEIDALGGVMGKAADFCAIQFRILNSSKGPAAQSSRAQIDMYAYNEYMRKLLSEQKNLAIKEAQVSSLIIQADKVCGVKTTDKEELYSSCVVIAAGTFLNGIVHIGLEHHSAGRINEPAAIDLSNNLKALGFDILRFKTGTCPRLDKNTIDFSRTIIQEGDNPPAPFSFSSSKINLKQLACHITHTNQKAHKIIADNLNRSPLYAGIIKSTGVRYCPSIEDKIVRFPERARHQIFLEPQARAGNEIYPNGLSTSLPEDVQLKFLHAIEGLEEAKVLRFGYGIEHDVVSPTQLFPTLETKRIKNLFLAGQINGTTGYEEAASLGLIAGINAGLSCQKRERFILDRSTSYIGVLIDDLVVKGTQEPYRMFTSRVEYRLIIREDNADLRLRKHGFDLGLVSKKEYNKTQAKEKAVISGINLLNRHRVKPADKINKILESLGTRSLQKTTSLEDILKRPEVGIKDLGSFAPQISEIPDFALREVEIEVKYSGFIKRQLAQVQRFKHLEKIRIPEEINYKAINGLSREIKEKLINLKPLNLGHASRISGVTPVAISILMVHLKKNHG